MTTEKKTLYDGPSDPTRGIANRHQRWPKYTVESQIDGLPWSHAYGPFFAYDKKRAVETADEYVKSRRSGYAARVLEWTSHHDWTVHKEFPARND